MPTLTARRKGPLTAIDRHRPLMIGEISRLSLPTGIHNTNNCEISPILA
jgi:hypothetical protein